MKRVLFMNVYRAGFYHRQGKPGTANLHAGDFYPTAKAAMENAEPDRGYITTVPFEIDVPDGMAIVINAEDSVPTPLNETRASLRTALVRSVPGRLLPWLRNDSDAIAASLRPWRDGPTELVGASLETPEGFTQLSYEQWRAGREVSGFQPLPTPLPLSDATPSKGYKPAHGGYAGVVA